MNSEIRVPEGMRERSRNAKHSEGAAYGVGFEDGMLFACHDLSEHPIVPTDDQCSDLCLPPFQLIDFGELRGFLERWQRRMFRAPDPEPELKDLFWRANPYPNTGAEHRHDEAVREAYRRGQKSRETK